MQIRTYESRDRKELIRMRLARWPDRAVADTDAWLARWDTLTLVADSGGGKLLGFAQVAERSHVDGCQTTPVAFIEGWWVDPAKRRFGIAAALVAAAEEWAAKRGYLEIAIGADAADASEQDDRRESGYSEVGKVIVFRKSIPRSERDGQARGRRASPVWLVKPPKDR